MSKKATICKTLQLYQVIRELVPNPEKTVIIRVESAQLKDVGLKKGDILIADFSAIPEKNALRIFLHINDYYVPRDSKTEPRMIYPVNKRGKAITIPDDLYLITGVVTHIICPAPQSKIKYYRNIIFP